MSNKKGEDMKQEDFEVIFKAERKKMLAIKFQSIVKKALKGYVDPWAVYRLEKLPAEKVTRHRYIPTTRYRQTIILFFSITFFS